jgi:hypothetical protein
MNPIYFDPWNGDYSLNSASPCIDAGTNLFVYNDDTLINIPDSCYAGMMPDMGAIEYDPLLGSPDNIWKNGGISLFPNPALNYVNISLDQDFEDSVEINLYTLDGKCIGSGSNYQGMRKGEVIRLDFPNIEPGIYLVQLRSTSNSWTSKLLVQN